MAAAFPRFALDLAHFVSANITAGRQLVIVSSGAVAAGRALIPPLPESGGALAARQALAALGQAQLIALWQRFFDRPVAQVLLTHDDLRNRRRYLNARATLRELLHLGTLPVVNENDTVSVDELKLGDNDNLAAIVAALIDAQALFIATDIDGLYTTDPCHHPDAQPLHEVRTLTLNTSPWLVTAAAPLAPAACVPNLKQHLKPAPLALTPTYLTAAAATLSADSHNTASAAPASIPPVPRLPPVNIGCVTPQSSPARSSLMPVPPLPWHNKALPYFRAAF